MAHTTQNNKENSYIVEVTIIPFAINLPDLVGIYLRTHTHVHSMGM